MIMRNFMTAVISVLIAATPAFANPVTYQVELGAVGNSLGNSLESGTTSLWHNNTDQDVTVVFDRTSFGDLDLQLPDGAEARSIEIASGDQISITFDTSGYYKFALSWSDGTISTGELAVATPEVVTIDIIGIRFVPQNIVVKAGQRIRWINTTGRNHTVTADPALARDPLNALVPDGADTFHSGTIRPGETFVMTFSVPGEYKYFCQPHERMGHLGSLIVE